MDKDMKQFIDTLPRELKTHNTYCIQTFDRDDNLVDTKYGVNLMTNYGFEREMDNISGDTSVGIVIGTGSSTPAYDDTDLDEIVPDSIAFPETFYTTLSTAIDVNRTNTWDPSVGLIGRRLTGSAIIDYNYEWLTEPVNIYEFGECQYKNNPNPYTPIPGTLRTHALIYDENHQRSYFTKKPNERIVIYVYRTMVLRPSTITLLWNQGRFAFVNPVFCVKSPGQYTTGSSNVDQHMLYLSNGSIVNGRCRSENDFPMYPIPYSVTDDKSNIHSRYAGLSIGFNSGFSRYEYSGNNPVDTRGVMQRATGSGFFISTAEPGEESRARRNKILFDEYVLTDAKFNKCNTGIFTYRYMHNTTSRSSKIDDAIFAICNYKRRTAENIEFDFAYTDDFLHARFNNIFGLGTLVYDHPKFTEQFIPVLDFSITSLSLYNYLTDSYDAETFTDDPTYDFRNPERGVYGVFSVEGFGDCNVFINTTPHIPIIGFNNPPSQTIYMTDTYWDPSSYVQLDDNSVVPQALQNKRYIIKTPMERWADANTFHINGTLASTASGINPIRQPSNHALVPTSQNVEINLKTDLPLTLTTAQSQKKIYASDTGWVYCCGRLIYPESNDGTGHPYEYEILPREEDLIKFTDTAIVTIINSAMVLNNSTTPRFYVFHIDPTHPEIDPNTTANIYYDSELTFGETSTKLTLVEWCGFMVDPHNTHLYISRNGIVYYIDLSDTDKNIETLETNEFDDGLLSIVYGTDYLVTAKENTDANTFDFTLYDASDKEVYETFTIPIAGTMVPHFILGFKGMIYFQVYRDSSTYSVFTYDYNSGMLGELTETCWYVLFNPYKLNTSNQYKWQYKFNSSRDMLNYDEDSMVINTWCSRQSGDSTNHGSRALVLNINALGDPYYFDDPAYTHTLYNSFIPEYEFGMPFIKKFNSGKNYVVMINGRPLSHSYGTNTVSNFPTQSYVFDIGYIMNKDFHTAQELMDNIVIPAYRMPNACRNVGGCCAPNSWDSPYHYDDNNQWFAYSTFYKNKVLVFTTFGKPLLIPIELFLPHKMIGKTYSIQAWNNPQGIGEHEHGEELV